MNKHKRQSEDDLKKHTVAARKGHRRARARWTSKYSRQVIVETQRNWDKCAIKEVARLERRGHINQDKIRDILSRTRTLSTAHRKLRALADQLEYQNRESARGMAAFSSSMA